MTARRQAAVVVAIFATPPHGIIFVERAAHLRDHPGQIGLPGGGVHPEDRDLAATALRELHEEVGVELARATIVGELPMLQQRQVNNFDVTPFVAVVEEGELRIDPAETAGVFFVPLAAVLDGAWLQNLTLNYEGRRIWGLTARILRSFVEQWTAGELRDRVVVHLSGDSPNAAPPGNP